MQLWKSLTKSLKSKMLVEHASEPKSDNVLAEETFSGKLLLILSFSMKSKSGSIWKKTMDIFLDDDQLKQVGYGPTLMGAGPSRSSSSSSSLAPQEANSPGQNYYFNMLLANCFQCNQQARSTVNQMFQPFLPESIDSQST